MAQAEAPAREGKEVEAGISQRGKMGKPQNRKPGDRSPLPPCHHGACGNFATFYPPIHHRYENWCAGALIIHIITIINPSMSSSRSESARGHSGSNHSQPSSHGRSFASQVAQEGVDDLVGFVPCGFELLYVLIDPTLVDEYGP